MKSWDRHSIDASGYYCSLFQYNVSSQQPKKLCQKNPPYTYAFYAPASEHVCVCGCLSRMWKWMGQVASAGQGAHILPRKQRMDHFVCRQRVKNSSQIIAVRQVTLFMRQHTSSTTSSCPSSGSASHTPYQLDILCHMQQTKPFLLFDVRFGGPKWRNEAEESWPWAFSSFFFFFCFWHHTGPKTGQKTGPAYQWQWFLYKRKSCPHLSNAMSNMPLSMSIRDTRRMSNMRFCDLFSEGRFPFFC